MKDLKLAKEAGLDSPLAQPLFESYKKAQNEGLGEDDVMAIIKSLRQE